MRQRIHELNQKVARRGGRWGRRPLLAWVLFAALVFSALPALPALCAMPAECGMASGQPCCGCCADAPEAAALCSDIAEPGPSLRDVRCVSVDTATPGTAYGATQGRGIRFDADDDIDESLADAPVLGRSLTACRRARLACSNAPPGHSPGLHPGRAPPATADNPRL